MFSTKLICGTPKAAIHTQAIIYYCFFLSICRLTPLQSVDIKTEKQPVKKVILCTLDGKSC